MQDRDTNSVLYSLPHVYKSTRTPQWINYQKTALHRCPSKGPSPPASGQAARTHSDRSRRPKQNWKSKQENPHRHNQLHERQKRRLRFSHLLSHISSRRNADHSRTLFSKTKESFLFSPSLGYSPTPRSAKNQKLELFS